MRDADTVEVIETHNRRGTAEQVYGPIGLFMLDQEEFSELTPRQRRQISGYILKAALTEATRSLVSTLRSARWSETMSASPAPRCGSMKRAGLNWRRSTAMLCSE